jgi:cell wall-associated NlpC family hydrolase
VRFLKYIFCIISLSLLVISCKSSATIRTSKKETSSKEASRLAKQLVDDASENLGSPYKAGGTDKKGFDCSGLVFVTFKKADIVLPRKSIDMSKMGRVINKDEIRKGDLIFFKTNGKSEINHVGLVVDVDDDEIKFIHSSSQLGVIISSTKEPYYGKSFAQANRIIE